MIWAVVFGSASSLSNNVFVMIGAYYLVDKKFKASRILNIWSEVAFYSIPLIILLLCIRSPYLGIRELVRGFIAYSGSPLWFSSCYITMLLFTPFMNILLKSEDKTRIILIILFFVNVIPSTFLFRNDFFYSGEFVWFCFLYLLVGYYKRYKKFYVGRNKCIIFAITIYLLIIMLFFTVRQISIYSDLVGRICSQLQLDIYYIHRYHTLPGFLCSIFIFKYFEELNISYNKVINILSQGTFAIYIIHQVPGFAELMWNDIFFLTTWIDNDYYPILFSLVVFCIYIFGTGLDFIRQKIFEPVYSKSKLYLNACNKIDRFFLPLIDEENSCYD